MDAGAWLELSDAVAFRDRFEWLAQVLASAGDERFASEVAAVTPALARAFLEIAEGSSRIQPASTMSRPGVASAHGLEHVVVGDAVAVILSSRPSPPVGVRRRVRSSTASVREPLLRR
jgi:hypothetical protein